MKKFLTVLLALSVVFTYTVGTAFALPSDDGTEAGLAAAKADAVKELENYPTMSDYNATGQAKVKAIIAEYTDKINDAKTVGATTDTETAKSVYGYLNAGKAAIDAVVKITELDDAKTAAKKQFTDYVYLIDALNVPVTNDAVKDAKIGYNTYASFKTAVTTAIDAAVDVEAVTDALSTGIEKADAIYAQLKSVEVSQDDIDNLVKQIRAKAATHSVNTKTHSASVVNAYEAAIEQGVAAAKAVATYDEYLKVADKYLGADASKAEVENGNVYVHVKQLSVFDQMNNKTIDVEKRIKAIEKVLATIGDYNYKNVDKDNWAEAEKFYAEAKYYIENGVFDKLTTSDTEPSLAALYAIAEGSDDKKVSASDATSVFNGKVDAVVAAYNTVTPLAVKKANLVAELNDYPADLDVYSDANATAIKAYRASGVNLINAATSVSAAKDAYDTYIDKIDAVDTVEAAEFKASIPEFNKAVDAYVSANKATTLSADQEALLTRFVADIKANYAAAETKYTDLEDATIAALTAGGTTNLGAVVAGIPYANGAGADAGYDIAAITTSDYNARNAGTVDGIQKEYAGETLPGIKTWVAFFTAYDKAMNEIDAVQTKVQEDYVSAITAAEEAIKAVGTPALTTAFKTALDKADAAITDYETAKAGFDALPADEKAEVTKTLDTSAYDDAAFEYARLVYVDGLGKQAADPIAEVEAFTAIAGDFLTPAINNLFSADAKSEIAKIVTDTYDAINAATTDAAKADAALKGIEKLDAIAVDGSGAAADLAELLAKIKDEAAKYFKKYENATFTSDATTKIDLVKDIIDFNAQFSDTVKEENEALKAAVKGTHMKIYSSAKKGYIKISWKKSNSDVALDGVEVYRSTKKASGFKKISTFKKQTSKKYTKNMKKGTKYYFYVKGYKMVGNEKVYTHNSIKVARTFRK